MKSRAFCTIWSFNKNKAKQPHQQRQQPRPLFVTLTRFGMPTADRIIPRHDHRSKPSDKVVVDCQCGRVRLSVPYADIRVDPPPPPVEEKQGSTYHAVVDCHCPSCRKYHVADRATYLLVPEHKVAIQQLSLSNNGGRRRSSSPNGASSSSPNGSETSFLTTFDDVCQHLGPVIRYQCSHCRTKLATRPALPGREGVAEDRPYGSDQYFLNLASARDDSLPKKWTKQWRAFRFPWQYANQCVWTRARAEGHYSDSSSSSSSGSDDSDDDEEDEADVQNINHYKITGSCSCGTYRYQINYPSLEDASTELQHCYCKLCRRLSGGPFQTWMPVGREFFTWLPRTDAPNQETAPPHEPPMHRYTDHGRRHVCDHCGGVLTIVYDADGDEVVWPAAGGLDDSSLPKTKEEMSKHLYGICHICCRYRQSWYALPNDGYAHIAEAS